VVKEQDSDDGEARSRALYYACRSVDKEKQRRGYEQLGSLLYPIAYRKLYDADLAHDCVQEALKQIHTHIDTIRNPSAFPSFAITTLKHEYARRGMQEAKQSRIEEAIKGEIDRALAQDDNRSPSIASISFLLDCLLAALGRLDEKSQMVVVLKYFSTLSDPQIATLLKTDTRNIYTRRTRAKSKLRNDPQLLACLRERTGWIDLTDAL